MGKRLNIIKTNVPEQFNGEGVTKLTDVLFSYAYGAKTRGHKTTDYEAVRKAVENK